MHFLARRLVHAVLVLGGVSILSFLLLELAPGDYLDEMRLNPQISPETVAALRARYGLGGSFSVRYIKWLGSVARGEWGYSFAYHVPVAELLWPRALNTLLLTATALLLTWVLAVPAGIWWAQSQGRTRNRLWAVGTSAVLGVPQVLLALLLLLLAVTTRAFPVGGMWSADPAAGSTWSTVQDLMWHMILPVLALVLSSVGVLVRHVRASVAEVLEGPFATAARARGLPRTRVLVHHVLPLAANPLITLFGLSVASLLSGSVLVEVIMGWPGLGPLLLEAILARDLYVVLGVVTCSAAFLVTGNLIADLLLNVSDPRVAPQ